MYTHDQIWQKVQDFLTKISVSEEVLIKYLRDNNIKGKRAEACDCVIAKALIKEFNLPFFVSRERIGHETVTRAWETPRTIRTFITEFDKGFYPEFEDNVC